MKVEETESSQKILSRVPSTKFESPVSSKFKLSGVGRTRKIAGKNLTSILLRQRQTFHVIDNDIDVTPKLLTHPTLSSIDERQMTAFETIGLSQASVSGSQLLPSPSGLSGMKTSSFSIVRTSSAPLGSILEDDVHFESLLSTQTVDSFVRDEDRAPSQFYLPSIDPNIFPTRPETVTIILRETETFFLFEMQPRTGDLHTPEGMAIKEENENYEYKTVGPGSNRKLVDSETQTIQVLTQSRGTYLTLQKRRNQGMFVNNWVIHDVYAAPEMMLKKNNLFVVHTKESMQQLLQAEELKSRLPKTKMQLGTTVSEEESTSMFQSINFWNAVRVMERIIASNIFIHAQKRFTGLIKPDPCSLDLEFTYSLDLLWTNNCEMNHGRPVSAFRWNYVRKSILAVGYGAKAKSQIANGLVLIWSAKNPDIPARRFIFDSPVADIDWSRERPNLLAIGLYSGEIIVLDASSRKMNIVRRSTKATSPSSSPQWQVQWWASDEQFEYQEQIYTCDQDGGIYCYRYVKDFTSTKLMKIFRIEGTLPGVNRTSHCNIYNASFNRSPGALVLRRHPTSSTLYFVGSDEGCIYKCSTNYLYQHIDSFLAHDGPVYSMMFSPYCPKIFLTCGADWYIRVWAEGLTEPLITMSTTMACVRCATWCPIHSTIIASIVNNEICIWDIKRKTHAPSSITVSPNSARFVLIDFTLDGNQLVVADVEGVVYVYNLEGMPFPPYNEEQVLIDSIEKALVTKPNLLQKLRKLGPPFTK
ncbi:dynein axonemal intermediate chain 4 [Osmia lignaria lignaria]|uniref:dynein axonemal intermediate chain 4 n=1 Tax=Osmia lignaria lignaria TaxID=1437193 RepID=UPI00402BCB73